MKKRYIVLIWAVMMCACIVLTGFTEAKEPAADLLKARTGIFKLLQYGELTQDTAKKQLYEIETGQQLEADLEYVDRFCNTEICRVDCLYIKNIERTARKSGYEVYQATVDWQFESGIYESIDYSIILKKIGKNYKIARISVLQ